MSDAVRAAPSARGKLAATPLSHGLVYARNRRLTGIYELTTPDGRSGSIELWRGQITRVSTIPSGAYLGTLLYELGWIDMETLNATLLELAQSRRLHGEILVERKAITADQLREALVEQACRKVHQLFALPGETTYSFYDAKPSSTEPPIVVDPIAAVWRGICDHPPESFVREVVARIGPAALKMVNEVAIDRGRLPPADAAVCELLTLRPMTLLELRAKSTLPPSRVDLLAYLLVIAKCVETVSGTRAHPSTGALPVSSPSGQFPAVPASDRIPVVTPGVAFPSSGAVPRARAISSQRMTAVRTSPMAFAPAAVVTVQGGPADLGAEGIVTRAQAIESESYFEILGVPEGASVEAVRAAYFRLAKLWHPDRLGIELAALRSDVTKIFTHMTRAQQTLCDPEARRGYLSSHGAKTTERPREDIVREIDIALMRRDYARAEEDSRALVDADPDDAEALALQAWAMAWAGEASEEPLRAALTKLDRAVNLDRTCDRAVYYRGVVHKRLGNLPGAFRDFARTIQINPKHVDAEREVRIFEMRARRGSGEQALASGAKAKKK